MGTVAGRTPLLENRNLKLLGLAMGVSALGDWMVYVAVVARVYSLAAGSGTAVGSLMVAELVPIFLFGPLAGVLVDRLPRKTVMLCCDLVRCGVALGLLAGTQVWHFLLLVFLLGLGQTFFNPALQAALPQVVAAPGLAGANALLTATINVAMVAGPALGGLLLAGWGTRLVFLADALSFAISGALIALTSFPARGRVRPAVGPAAGMPAAEGLLRPEPSRRGATRLGAARLGGEFLQGLTFVRHNRVALAVLASTVLIVLVAGGLNVIEMFFAVEVLEAGERGYGFLISAWGTGMILGSFVFYFLSRWLPSLGSAYRLALLTTAAGVGLTGLSPNLWSALVFSVMGGLGNGISHAARGTILQTVVPGQLLGRVMATYNMAVNGGLVASMSLAGLLADAVNPRMAYGFAAAGSVLAWVLATIILGRGNAANAWGHADRSPEP